MASFLALMLYCCFGAMVLVVWPVMAHPTLPMRKKILLSLVVFLVLVPGSIALYLWVGAPMLVTH